jgi:hypothetical protein
MMLEYIRSLDPKIVYSAISAQAGLMIYVWRKVSIKTWDAVTRKNEMLQTLPAIILSGLMSAAPAIGKPLLNVVANIVFGALFGGAGAVVSHQILKASPLPYSGGQGSKRLFPPADSGGTVTTTSEAVTPVSNPSRKENL